MVFAALVTVPAASFLCGSKYLFFFCLFPLAAAVNVNFRYFRNIVLLAFAPLLILLWAIFTGNSVTIFRSIRWIAALTAGSYFAGALGTAGIALVLRRMGSPFQILAETMESAGPAVRTAGKIWQGGSELPLIQRVSTTLSEALTAEPEEINPPGIKAVPVYVAAVSWLFLLGTVSGGFK